MSDQSQTYVRRIAEWCGWRKEFGESSWHAPDTTMMAREGTLTPAGAIAALEKARADKWDYILFPTHPKTTTVMVSFWKPLQVQAFKAKAGNELDAIRDALGQALEEG